jgi:hypothetical protein
MFSACDAQTNAKESTRTEITNNDIHVYYFHFTRRCATCNAVENESKKAVAELYGDKVSFTGYNLDEPDGQEMGKELKVSGQSLLIVRGENQINITNEGFMYARANPEKLNQIIKEKIEILMK